MWNRVKGTTWLWVVCGVLIGCAGVRPEAEEAALRARAQARWEAILAGDFARVREFYPPELRAAHSLEQLRYEYTILARRERVAIEGVYFPLGEPNRATVVVKQWFVSDGTVTALNTEPVGIHEELWEKQAGQWWFIRTY